MTEEALTTDDANDPILLKQSRVEDRYGEAGKAGWSPVPDVLLLNQHRLGINSTDLNVLTKRINHSESYSTDEANTNQAESFFSRLRRAEIGIHHHVAGPYLSAYAREMAWRENNRRVSNGEQYLMAADAALQHPVSRQWKGYWQRAIKG
jgi:hypothetical protein